MQLSHLSEIDRCQEDSFDDETNPSDVSLPEVKFRRNQMESTSYPVLHRALSTVSANQTLVNNQRNALAKNYRRTSINDEIVTIDHHDADASFILPNLNELAEEIRLRVMENLVDTPTMISLEENKRLNWWIDKNLPCPKLYPLLTSGDGNCLLHATSLAMWGFHDHSLSMRKALNETLITSKPNNSLYRRWRWTQSVQNKKYGLVFSEQEWDDEWKSLLRLSSAEPRISQTKSSDSVEKVSTSNETSPSKSAITGGSIKGQCQSIRQYYESLEEFHVYVLANNIRRPIVIYSDTILRTNDGEAISPIEFGGLYLPLEIPPEKCHKQPVFLAFDAAHFSALVPMEQNSKSISKVTFRIPLIDIETLDLLPIHFLIDPGRDFVWPVDEELSDEKILWHTNSAESRLKILEQYLNLSKETLPIQRNSHDESTSTMTSSTNSELTNETSSPTPIHLPKKSSRSSLVSFSKIIRRTFIHPFSAAKRFSLKHQQQIQQHQNNTHDDSIVKNDERAHRRKSSPLFNRSNNVLTVILSNFQPKRPRASDNMIKNYIDAYINDYQLEQLTNQPNHVNSQENELTHPMNINVPANGKFIPIDSDQQEQQNSTFTHASSANSNDSSKQDAMITGRVTSYTNGRSIEITRPRRQLPQTPHQSSPNRNQIYPESIENNNGISENIDLPITTNLAELSSATRSHSSSNGIEPTTEFSGHVNGHWTETSSSSKMIDQKLFNVPLKRPPSTKSEQLMTIPLQFQTNLTNYPENGKGTSITAVTKHLQSVNGSTTGYLRDHEIDARRRL